MDALSFTAQDIIGSLIAFSLFPVILVYPGYTVSWLLDLFTFRRRTVPVRFGIALLISMAICPIVIFLLYRILGLWTVWVFLIICFCCFTWLLGRDAYLSITGAGSSTPSAENRKLQVGLLGLGIAWVTISIVSLVDLQFGNRLYFSVVSLDYSTRVAVVDAITRTGVPPANPGYYPGHPVPMTILYYFWYILASLVDQIGGRWVDARIAMSASAAWCGLALIATVVFYLRQREPGIGRRAWRSGLIGVLLLGVTGLDILPYGLFTGLVLRQQHQLVSRGAMEFWNEQIGGWLGSLLWAPNHVAGAIAGLVGIMLFQFGRAQPGKRRIAPVILTGLAFASCAGLSTWIALVLALFWAAWMVDLYIKERQPRQVRQMLLVGCVSILAAAPFLIGVIQPVDNLYHSTDAAAGQPPESTEIGPAVTAVSGSPVTFQVREFTPASGLLQDQTALVSNLAYLALLPINYLLELGFFFFAGLAWFQYRKYLPAVSSSYTQAEVLLLGSVLLVTSFFRSTVLWANDLGMRGWLPGQFILLIWTVDVLRMLRANLSMVAAVPVKIEKELAKLRIYLLALAAVGVISTISDLALLRFYPIIGDSSQTFLYEAAVDGKLGERTYAARQAYRFINESTPSDTVFQYSLREFQERTSGIYASRQAALSDHTMFGITQEMVEARAQRLQPIFDPPGQTNWAEIDRICRNNWIDIILINDLDKIWNSLDQMHVGRQPLYQNRYFEIFSCGN